MNCAVLSYDDTAYFGLTGDVNAIPDLERWQQLLHSSFSDLRQAAGLGSLRRRTRPAPENATTASDADGTKAFHAGAGG